MTDFEAVYREHFTPVYSYLLSLCRDAALAEDITQETFFRALKAIDRFDGRCKLSVWLCQIAKNCWYDRLRRQKSAAAAAGPAENGSTDVEQQLLDRDEARQIHRLLHRLEEPYKEVFSLRVFGELPFAQIAELFGKTESWARVTFYRAKEKIREGLK